MANTKSAAKRARQTAGRTDANKRVTTAVKNQLRQIRAAVTAGKKSEALALLPKVASALDKAAKTGRIHQNKANRHKGDLARQLAALK
jgi:small subunit ribosomal protein S20